MDACLLGLVMIGDKAKQALQKLLSSEDGWIRFCASLGLRAIAGKNHACDWLFGDARTRESAARKYLDE